MVENLMKVTEQKNKKWIQYKKDKIIKWRIKKTNAYNEKK